VRIEASGLCHAGEHVRLGGGFAALSMVGGHEGEGLVEQIGPGVINVAVGDQLVLSFVLMCGRCRWCLIGLHNLCDFGAFPRQDEMNSGGYRVHADGKHVGTLGLSGTLANHAVVLETSVVSIAKDIPFGVAYLLGRRVPTGLGSAVYVGCVQSGESVVVVGIGGAGANALQGTQLAGAKGVIAVDPVEFKREQAMKFGATHTGGSMEEAMLLIAQLTDGVMANIGICTIGLVEEPDPTTVRRPHAEGWPCGAHWHCHARRQQPDARPASLLAVREVSARHGAWRLQSALRHATTGVALSGRQVAAHRAHHPEIRSRRGKRRVRGQERSWHNRNGPSIAVRSRGQFGLKSRGSRSTSCGEIANSVV
jgi:threonine dehydrogenase-like Zn-dependent dehydrogenase